MITAICRRLRFWGSPLQVATARRGYRCRRGAQVSLRKKLTEYNMMKRKREVERKKRAAEAEAAAAKPVPGRERADRVGIPSVHVAD